MDGRLRCYGNGEKSGIKKCCENTGADWDRSKPYWGHFYPLCLDCLTSPQLLYALFSQSQLDAEGSYRTRIGVSVQHEKKTIYCWLGIERVPDCGESIHLMGCQIENKVRRHQRHLSSFTKSSNVFTLAV